MNLTVSSTTQLVLTANIILALAVPIILVFFLKKNYHCQLKPFFFGIAAMILFAFVLEGMVNQLIFMSPLGTILNNNVWLYAITGALMAGLFEETGRLVTMRYMLKDYRGNDFNALMYGAGHGGIEMMILLITVSINNLIYATIMNAGGMETIMQGMNAADAQELGKVLEQLATSSPLLFAAAPIERLAAIAAQLGLSMLVWYAATRGGITMRLYYYAIGLHVILDAVPIILTDMGMEMFYVEAVILGLAAFICAIGYKAYQQCHDMELAEPLEETF